MIRGVLKAKTLTIVLALAALLVTLWPASRLGTEFMPNLNEGTLFYMPTTLPGISITKAAELLQMQDRIIKTFPEVVSVYGKAGRASTATDPAPTEMYETVINLKPKEEWRAGVTVDSLIAEMDKALQFPGVSNAWTMPIKARIDMLSTGIRTPVGVKVFGTDLRRDGTPRARNRTGPQNHSRHVQRLCRARDRRLLSRYRSQSRQPRPLWPDGRRRPGRDRNRARRRCRHHHGRRPRALHGQCPLSPGSAQQPAIDRERRAGAAARRRHGARSAMSLRSGLNRGPTTIRTENGQLATYIFVDIRDRDLGGYVAEAQKAVAASIQFPPGYYVTWSGQFEYLQRAEARLKVVVPVTLLIIFLLLYLNFRTLTETLIVMLSLPFSLVGGLWLLWWLGFNLSVAVAVGFIALAGVAAETGVVMLIYLDHALTEIKAECVAEGRPFTRADLHAAIMQGAVERVRPKMMTVVAIMAGLLPIMWSTGTGSEVMQRIAVPMIGGMISSTLLTLVVIPAIYGLVKGWRLQRERRALSAPARALAKETPR